MKYHRFLKNVFQILYRLISYNLKIIFAGKFMYFLMAAIFIFLFVTIVNLFNANSNPTEATGYRLLLVPGLLLIFYPTTFGIQNDRDTRMLEILFGIPNYRYKIWFVRIMLIFMVASLIIVILTMVYSFVLAEVSIFMMVFHLMFPVLFTGSLAFMFSTIIRNGNGTAIIIVLFGIFFWISKSYIGDTEWFVFLNPYEMPENMNEVVWYEITFNNRVYLLAGSIGAMLLGLLNLQNREKFL